MEKTDLGSRALSAAQTAIWETLKTDPENCVLVQAHYFDIGGSIDLTIMALAIRTAVSEMDALHVKIVEFPDGPQQSLPTRASEAVPVLDFEDEGDPLQSAKDWMRNDMSTAGDLVQWPYFRFALLKIGAGRFLYYVRVHHIIGDGVSAAILSARVAALYSSLLSGKEAPKDVRPSWFDTLEEERRYRTSKALKLDRDYWASQMHGWSGPTTLSGKSPSRTSAYHRYTGYLSKPILDAVEQCQKAAGASFAEVMMAAIGGYISRLSGTLDVTIDSVVAGRLGGSTRRAFGNMSNVLPLRLTLNRGQTIRNLLAVAAKRHREMLRHQRYRGEDIRREFRLQDSMASFGGTFVNLMSFDYDLDLGDGVGREHMLTTGPVNDIEFWIYNRHGSGGARVTINANPNNYTEDDLSIHFRRFVGVLEQLTSNDLDAPVDSIEIVDPKERETLLRLGTAPRRMLVMQAVSDMFEEQVARTPNLVAVSAGGQRLTFDELNTRANQIAHDLIRRGITTGNVVAIGLNRSVELVACLIAILKVGAAFLPLNLNLPHARIARLLSDAEPLLVIADSQQAEILIPDRQILRLDRAEEESRLASLPVTNPSVDERTCRPLADDPAYIIYTSGSTGSPKGVVVGYGALASFLVTFSQEIRFDVSDRHLAVTTITFDISILELLLPLLKGAQVIVAHELDGYDPKSLTTIINNWSVTSLQATPSLFRLLVAHDPHVLANIRVMVGGEALSRQLAQALCSSASEVWNLYGPTEATIWACVHRLSTQQVLSTSDNIVSIGRPLGGVRAYILDHALKLAPIGVTGDLYLAGDTLARGYLNQQALTADRFVLDPYGEPGSRMYRTGDLAYWREDGMLQFVGRSDDQIKIRGHRVEPGEIEALLRQHANVSEAVVTSYVHEGETRLVAHVLPQVTDREVRRGQVAQVKEWNEAYAAIYRRAASNSSAADASIWRDSYSGMPIPSLQMKMWLDETVDRLRPLKAKRILEIGCGTGALLKRLAVEADQYVGIDFASEAIESLRRDLWADDRFANVALHDRPAVDLSFLDDNTFDLVILSSTIQYFPDLEYLIEVLKHVVRVSQAEGAVYLGDVRSLPLLAAFHTSVELFKAMPNQECSVLRQRIQEAIRTEKELVIDPSFFVEIANRWSKIGQFELSPKLSDYDNEISRFRYDVILRMGENFRKSQPDEWIQWDHEGIWQDSLAQAMAERPGQPVGLRCVPDRRVLAAVEHERLLNSASDNVRDADRLRGMAPRIPGETLGRVRQFAHRLGASFSWSGFGKDGAYDAVFNCQELHREKLKDEALDYYRQFANLPWKGRIGQELGFNLQAYLRQFLPEYMVPSLIQTVDTWPLTASGKVDRKALSVPPQRLASSYRAPRNEQERKLCEIFEGVLALEQVSIDDDFFSLGGNSLAATRVVTRIRDAFGIELSGRALFEAPTVAGLATQLSVQAVVSNSGSDASRTTLLGRRLVIRSSGAGRPLICFHPITGLCWSYMKFATKSFGDRPIYGLQSRGLDHPIPLAQTIDEAIGDCLEDLHAIQPTGPYQLLGWSFGGTLAHRVACALQERGETVRMLALMDSYPLGDYGPPIMQSSSANLREWADLVGLNFASVTDKDLTVSKLAEVAYATNHALLRGLDVPAFERLVASFENNRRLSKSPADMGCFQGDMLLFTAAERQGTSWPPVTRELWRPYCTDEIRLQPLSAAHNRLCDAEPATRISIALSQYRTNEDARNDDRGKGNLAAT